MEIRAYIRPTGLQTTNNQHGGKFFIVGDQQAVYQLDAGIPYITTRIDSPIHPDLRKRIIRVTIRTCVEDQSHMDMIETGQYIHGKFSAEAKRQFSGGRWITWIDASAPSISMLQRFLRPILAGQDKPTHSYKKVTPATSPVPPHH